jgi:hypothetical protein
MVNLHTTTHAMRAGQRYKSQHILFHYSATKHRLQVAIDTCSTQKSPTRICTHCSPIRGIQLAAFKALVGPRRTAVQGMAAPNSHHNHALLFTCVVFFVLAVEVEKARTSKPRKNCAVHVQLGLQTASQAPVSTRGIRQIIFKSPTSCRNLATKQNTTTHWW